MRRITAFVSTILVGAGLALPAMAQTNLGEIGTFENFLNAHPNTASELQQNPSLINNPNWMSHHQGLEEYMSEHPYVRNEVHQNPGAFIENGGHWNWNNGGYGYNGGNPNNGAAWRFDHGYLSEHPEVANQLALHPALADNSAYLSSHPGLSDYLQNHPTIRQDLISHPDRFMSREDQLNGRSPAGAYGNNEAVWRFDHGYLSEHPEVANQLALHPGLADNSAYLSSHPGLSDYLQSHPGVRQDLISHPDRFMSREDQLDGHSANYGAPGTYHAAPPPYGYNPGPHPMSYDGGPDGHAPGYYPNGHALGSADNYFDNHPEVYQQMEKDPRLVDNQHYVDTHPGLHDYLESHPHAGTVFKNHPDAFMGAAEHYQQNHPEGRHHHG
jgi:hypothetical protein